MKRRIKKIFAFLLLLSMVVTLLPNAVFAAADQKNTEPDQKSDENITATATGNAAAASTTEGPEANKKVLADTAGSDHLISMSVYLLYSNTLPTKNGELDIDREFTAHEFGPSGDDTSYFNVTIDLEKLLGKTGMNAKYDNNDKFWYISLATCTGLSDTMDTRLEIFWNNVLDCMSKEDQDKFASNFGGNYKGYVVKHESGNRIDGILAQNPVVYLTEVFGPDANHSLIASHSETSKTHFSKIIEDVQTYYRNELKDNNLVASMKQISEDGNTIQIALKNNITGDSNNGLEYLVTLTGTPLTTGKNYNNKSYPNYVEREANKFYVANYTITSIEQKTVHITLSKVWEDENDIAKKRDKVCPIWICVKAGDEEKSTNIQFSKKRGWETSFIVPVSTENDFYQVTEYYQKMDNPSTSKENDYVSEVTIVKPILENGLVVNQPSITVTNTCITNTGKLTVTKIFDGLDSSAITSLKENGFAIVLTGDKVKTPISLTLDQAVVEESTNTYTWSLDTIPTGTYTIEEKNAGYTGYTQTEIASVNGGSETELSESSVTIMYASKDNTLTVKNTYTKSETENVPDTNPPVVDVPTTDTPTTDIPGSGDDTNIDDTDTPTTDVPDTGDDTNIDDTQTPTTNTPDTTDQNKNGTTDLVDNGAPMSNAPKTGDPFILWGLLAAASASGVVGYTFKKKKDHDEK